jgi:group I intron endonuclease
MTSGIYEIVNTTNGKRYVGSAINLDRRWKAHCYNLSRGKHINIHLQRSWKKSGEKSFRFSVIELCEKSRLIEREQIHIDSSRPEFNICPTAGSTLGAPRAPHSAKTRAKIGKASRKIWADPDFRKRFSLSRIGTKPSSETRLKMSVAALGKKKSDETRERMRAAAIAAGRKVPVEHLANRIGTKHSDETRAKMSAASVGRKKSDSHRASMREAWKRRRARQELEASP